MDNIWICDDRPHEISDEVKKMSEEEIEKEFQRLFGKYLEEGVMDNGKY